MKKTFSELSALYAVKTSITKQEFDDVKLAFSESDQETQSTKLDELLSLEKKVFSEEGKQDEGQ